MDFLGPFCLARNNLVLFLCRFLTNSNSFTPSFSINLKILIIDALSCWYAGQKELGQTNTFFDSGPFMGLVVNKKNIEALSFELF